MIINESLKTARLKYDKAFGEDGSSYEFQEVVDADPTPQKKYLDKMVDGYIESQNKEGLGIYHPKYVKLPDFPAIKKCINKFHNLVQNHRIVGKQADIYSGNGGDFKNFIAKMEMTQSKGEEKIAQSQNGMKKIFENDKCIVYEILTQEAANYFCKGTNGCIRGRDTFISYMKQLKMLYFVIDKSSKNLKIVIDVPENGRPGVGIKPAEIEGYNAGKMFMDSQAENFINDFEIFDIIKPFQLTKDEFNRRYEMMKKTRNNIIIKDYLYYIKTFIREHDLKTPDGLPLEESIIVNKLDKLAEFKDFIGETSSSQKIQIMKQGQQKYPEKEIIFDGIGLGISSDIGLGPKRLEIGHKDVGSRLGGILYDIKRINGKQYFNIETVRLDKKYQGRSYANLMYDILLDLSKDGLVIDTTAPNIHQGTNSNIGQTLGGYKGGEYIIIPKKTTHSH